MFRLTTFTLLVFLIAYAFPNGVSGQFAELVSLTHSCNGSGGSVEFEIIGDPEDFTYYWEHGPTELALYNLPPGFYTLYVENFFGCVETYDVEILDLQGCSMNYYISESADHCFQYVNIIVYDNATGMIINEAALNVVWSDGSTAGLFRAFSKSQYGTYCVTITSSDPAQTCCYIQHCFVVQKDPRCKKKPCKEVKLLVNETSRRQNGGRQFVEILVTGECECEETTDIRGFYLDDNDGSLIPANEFINSGNLSNIGIDMGFLGFNFNPVWAAVPNGSLIVIYDEDELNYLNMPADDPSDANQDNVYVLAANNTEYLFGKSGVWDQTTKLQTYTGTFVDPTWDLIEISPDADGLQIRKPDGEFEHGISLGETQFSAINTFPLWLTPTSPVTSNSRFTGTDLLLKEHYSTDPAESNLQTPGLSNSIENQLFRDSLLNCDPRDPRDPVRPSNTIISPFNKSPRNKNQEEIEGDFVTVYPNPFSKEIFVNVFSNMSGESSIIINSITGQNILSQKLSCKKGQNQFNLDLGNHLIPGIYVLQLSLPSGIVKTIRLVHFNSN